MDAQKKVEELSQAIRDFLYALDEGLLDKNGLMVGPPGHRCESAFLEALRKVVE